MGRPNWAADDPTGGPPLIFVGSLRETVGSAATRMDTGALDRSTVSRAIVHGDPNSQSSPPLE